MKELKTHLDSGRRWLRFLFPRPKKKPVRVIPNAEIAKLFAQKEAK